MPPGETTVTPQTRIRVDPYCRRSIRGISELDRQAYFGLCDAGTDFPARCRTKERYDWLIKENGITFGRRLGIVKGLDRWYQAIREDPARPGFADVAFLEKKLAPHRKDPTDEFRRDMGGRLNVAAHGNHNAFPEFMGAHMSEAAAKDEKTERLPENIAAAAELSAAALRAKYTDFDRPAYYEPVNEPHWSYWRGEHLANWHTRTMEVVHEQVPGVLVGGPCMSVAYFYRNRYKAFDGLTAFIDNTDCALDFYSFHVYDFLRDEDGDFRGRITSGLPLESVLDLLQNYTVNTYGREIAVVISEHGGYGALELVERLAEEQFTETGFEWEMKKRSIDDFNMVSSVLANTLVFMDHPQTVWKAVPFILLNGLGWNPAYYASLYVPRDYDPENKEWLSTKKIMFYRLLRDLKGHRVAGSCPDPDIQMRAFAHGATLFVILNNVSNADKRVSLDIPPPTGILVRRFGRNPDYTPYLVEEALPACDGLLLKAREAVVVKAAYPQALDPRQTVDEIPYYGDRFAVPVEAEPARFSVRIPDPAGLQYATMRIGISRPPDAGWNVTVTFNGEPVNVPREACAERVTQPENEYASCKIIPLEPARIKTDNSVTVSFPDGKPGAVGAVVIRAGRVAQAVSKW
jgi:hypothetical protein